LAPSLLLDFPPEGLVHGDGEVGLAGGVRAVNPHFDVVALLDDGHDVEPVLTSAPCAACLEHVMAVGLHRLHRSLLFFALRPLGLDSSP